MPRALGRAALQRPFLLYAPASLALIAIWDGRLLLTRQIGIWDWEKEAWGLEFLKSALAQGGGIPRSFLATPDWLANYPALFQSASYWANPEVVTMSPFLVFLPWTSVPVFLKLAFFGHLAIAAVGTYVVGRRLELRTTATLFLFVVVILNPWLVQHLAIGYSPWITICYIPLVVAGLLSPLSVGWFVVATVADALILYEGGLHLFIWFNLTVVLVALAAAAFRRSRAHLPRVGAVLLGTMLLSAPKLVAILSAYGNWRRPIQSSYRSAHDLWGLLTDADASLYDLPHAYHVYDTAVYDASTFTGTIFLATLVLAVGWWAWRTFARRRGEDRNDVALTWMLLGISALWLVLGWNGVWRALVDVVPSLGFEIYPFRFLAIAVLLAAVVVTLTLDRASRKNGLAALGCLGVATAIAVTLWSRNDYFVGIATSKPYAVPGVRNFLHYAVTARRPQAAGPAPSVDQSLAGVTIDPAGSRAQIRLGWLPTEHVHDFTIGNAQIVEQDGLGSTVVPDDADRLIQITPHGYNRGLLLVVSVVAYGVFVGALRARSPSSPRRRGFRRVFQRD